MTSNQKYHIPSGDALIHCEISGREDAHALLLLHGNGEDLRIFDPYIGYFSQHYRTIAVDTRGHGQSTRGTAPFRFHNFADDILAIFDALQISKAHIIGFSDGAIIALHMALTAPERISSMVLLGANCNPEGILLKYRFSIRLVFAWLSVAALFSTKMRKRREIWGLMVSQPNLTFAEISRINVPALVVTGENDMVSQHHNDSISRAITGSKRVVVPNGDHFWMFKKPETLIRLAVELFASSSVYQHHT